MKKLLALLLAVVMVLSLGSVMAFAEGASQIVIDGVKDDIYTDKKCITYDYWNFYNNDGQTLFEPVDYERMINTLWFDWDDNYVYLYFQCESQDDLYKPAPEETKIADYDFGPFYEIAQVYLDTAPSIDFYAPCNWANTDGNGEFCNHICCNCRSGEGSGYRLMARANPAWGEWNDYYATASGMFMSYETFSENYAGREGYEDMEAAYAAAHGTDGSQAASFIDYDTNTYGFELKFPRVTEEEFFQVNVRTRVNEKEWEEYGPELPYSLSMCPAWWMNSEGMLEIYFEDYEGTVDPAVAAIQRQIAELPSADLIGREHKDALTAIFTAIEGLTEEQGTQFTDAEMEWLLAAAIKMELFNFVDSLGKINDDDVVDAKDALVALKASVNKVQLTEDQALRADVTGDEKVDAKDALEMLQFAVRKRTQFTVAGMLEL